MQPTQTKTVRKRRAVVIVAVLVVVTLLLLAGYQYADMMTSEARVAENAHRAVQLKALADSGVAYAAAMLSQPDNFNDKLGGNPWNNPEMFKGKLVQESEGIPKGYFTLLAPPNTTDDGSGGVLHGVTDEGGRLNLNSLLEIELSNEQNKGIFVNMVSKLHPKMTREIAAAIRDWLDPDEETYEGGAESDFYLGLTPPYRCKNAPLDSIDGLMLVKGMTPELLYGTDINRNGTQDESETAGEFDRGLSALITVHSREQNVDSMGKPAVNLQMKVSDLKIALMEAGFDEGVIKFIVLFRKSGKLSSNTPSGNPPKKLPQVAAAAASVDYEQDVAYRSNFTSLFQLVDRKKEGIKVNNKQFVKSPFVLQKNLDGSLELDGELLSKLFAVAGLWDPSIVDPVKINELPARININTAPSKVLETLVDNEDKFFLTKEECDQIILNRSEPGSGDNDAVFQSPAWLVTKTNIDIAKLTNINKFITTRSQVFRVQSVGYLEGKGPSVRVEAVIDTNNARPRIIAYRNLTELGKGWKGELTP